MLRLMPTQAQLEAAAFAILAASYKRHPFAYNAANK
jgi:hypothetical protein